MRIGLPYSLQVKQAGGQQALLAHRLAVIRGTRRNVHGLAPTALQERPTPLHRRPVLGGRLSRLGTSKGAHWWQGRLASCPVLLPHTRPAVCREYPPNIRALGLSVGRAQAETAFTTSDVEKPLHNEAKPKQAGRVGSQMGLQRTTRAQVLSLGPKAQTAAYRGRLFFKADKHKAYVKQGSCPKLLGEFPYGHGFHSHQTTTLKENMGYTTTI